MELTHCPTHDTQNPASAFPWGPFAYVRLWRLVTGHGAWSSQAPLYLNSTLRGSTFSVVSRNSMGLQQPHVLRLNTFFYCNCTSLNLVLCKTFRCTIKLNTYLSAEVRKVGWWMCMYGAGSPKRQWAWSNGRAIMRLDVGWKRMKPEYQTVRHYTDKKAVRRYHGTKALRFTENLGLMYFTSYGECWRMICPHSIHYVGGLPLSKELPSQVWGCYRPSSWRLGCFPDSSFLPFASASRCWNCPCRSAWPGPVFNGQSDGGGQIFEVWERTKSPRPLESHNSQTLKLQGCRFPALRSLSGNISKLTNDRRILRFRVSNIFEPIYFLKKLNGYFSDLNCFWWLFYAPNEGYPKFFPSKPIFLSTHPIFLSTKLRKNPVNIAKPGFWQPVINP